ncbi:MAG: dipeptide ABC transporter ATP-binding protein [Desulfarculaceae bacterium]
MNSSAQLLRVEGLKKFFPVGKGLLFKSEDFVQAVNQVSFSINKGETLGLVGESGSGKTTVGRCILRLIEPTAGQVFLEGTEVTGLPPARMREMRRHLQIIFQDPYGSLTPRMRLYSLLREPLRVHGLGQDASQKEMVSAMLEKVGLRPEHLSRFPHEFSGGQRQRIAIARALMLNPKLIIADEPVSALDVSIQAQIINLMVRLQRELDLSYLFISHDLGVIKYVSDRIAVMYLGRIVELADRNELCQRPLHPYTEALLSAVPVSRPGGKSKRVYLEGEVPSPLNPPSGCNFHPRCRYQRKECSQRAPAYKDVGNAHYVACHLR